MKRLSLVGIAGCLLIAVACDFQHKESLGLAPSSVSGAGDSGSGGSAAVASYVGAWASQNLQPIDSNSCGNFEWNIISQSETSISGDFSALCLGMVQLSGTASGKIENSSAVGLTADGTANLGGLECNFSLDGTGTLEPEVLRVDYTAQTCVGPFSGTETLKRGSLPGLPAPEPAPAPPPAPTPTPAPTPSPSADQLDLSQVTYVLGPSNVGSWPQTSTITRTVQVPHNLCIYHTKLGKWPSTIFFGDPNTLVEGNQWVFANIGGRWYGGAADWYRPGQACKDVTAQSIGRDAFYNPAMEPLRSWEPKAGEVFGLMATTPARMWPNMRTVDQRSNVVLVRWDR